MRQLWALGMFLALSANPAHAADDIIKGVYLKSEKLCQDAKKSSLQQVIEAGNLVLTNRGIDEIEYNCAFVQILKHPRIDTAWVATAFCEEPGYASPDVFSIIQREPNKLEIASLSEGNAGGAPEDEEPATGEGGALTGENAAPPAGGTDATPPTVDEGSYSTIGGTYFRCDGVTMP